MADLTFELFKLHQNHNSHMDEEQRESNMPMQGQKGKSVTSEEYFRRDDLEWMGSFSTSNVQNQLKQFYLKTKFDHQFVISRSDFFEVYPFVKELEIFTWIPEIVSGLKMKHINTDIDMTPPPLQSRLTRVIEDRAKKDLTQSVGEDTKLSEEEVANLTEFFNNDIKNKPAKEVMKVFTKMFKDFKN